MGESEGASIAIFIDKILNFFIGLVEGNGVVEVVDVEKVFYFYVRTKVQSLGRGLGLITTFILCVILKV